VAELTRVVDLATLSFWPVIRIETLIAQRPVEVKTRSKSIFGLTDGEVFWLYSSFRS
jgi:hypothetical protein